jgi:hypothetical protein
MRDAFVVAAVALAACGPIVHRPSTQEEAVRALAGDEAQIRSMMRRSIGFGGAHFADPACAQQFPAPRTIPQRELDAFAHCVAGLHLQSERRTSALPDFLLLTYAPGIELEVRTVDDPPGRQLVWLGYLGSAGERASLPTITPDALAAVRVAGDAHPHLGDDEGAWLKICVDRDGGVTGAHVVAASSKDVGATLANLIAEWKFHPIEIDGVPSPVCSWLLLTGGGDDGSGDPVPIAPLLPGAVGPRPERVSGEVQILPTDKQRLLINRAHLGTLVTTVRYCVDADGSVNAIAVYESSGLQLYDSIITSHIRDWKFKPPDGEVCQSASLIYIQR